MKKQPAQKEAPLHRIDAWTVAENSYTPPFDNYYDTIFTLANGTMGLRGAREESMGGAAYYAGVYAHYDAQHEWARTGFSTKSDKLVQILDWIGLSVSIAGEVFDPVKGKVSEYDRQLDMSRGILQRTLVYTDKAGRATRFEFTRFLSMVRPAVGVIRCTISPLGHKAAIKVRAELSGRSGIDAAWGPLEARVAGKNCALLAEKVTTTGFEVAAAMRLCLNSKAVGTASAGKNKVAIETKIPLGEAAIIDKLVAICSSRDPGVKKSAALRAIAEVDKAEIDGFDTLLQEQIGAWEKIWFERDVVIEGDVSAQQGVRFSIFQMEQSYSGKDNTLNIGARALSCLDHGGHYFWDTEVYMIPYFIWQAPEKARALLIHRHQTLPQAVARAQQHGYPGAMYPWCTIDGTESEMAWEYSQLQVHVTAAIAYGVWYYVSATHDYDFLAEYGAELIIQSCRFWASRSFFAADGTCRINCVTGPDEYTVAADNDHYTNVIVRFVFRKSVALLEQLQKKNGAAYRALLKKLGFKASEMADWLKRANAMRIPYVPSSGIFPQHETFMDMEPVDLTTFPQKWRPAALRCPWERLIRLQAIKQPDVLLAMHLLAEEYTPKQLKANFDFYDPKTMHESSLGACTHAIIATMIGNEKKAYEYYLMGARLDLDFRWTKGIRIANTAGTWQVLVNGFAGMRLSIKDETLSFAPQLPKSWKALSFALHFRGRRIMVRIDQSTITLDIEGKKANTQVVRKLTPGRSTRIAISEGK